MSPCDKCGRVIRPKLDDDIHVSCEYCAYPQMPNAVIAAIRRRAFREAAHVVRGHWNNQISHTNQYGQAQRSSAALLAIAKDEKS